MSGARMGSLMAGTSPVAPAEARVSFWRRTYDVDDARAQVGRVLGDGSARQGKIVLATIIEATKEWFRKANEDARVEYAGAKAAFDMQPDPKGTAPSKRPTLKWNLLTTLEAVLSFTDFKTGECIATYEMIASRADCCRDTVYRHLNILRRLKLLEWVRRCEPTRDKKQPNKAAPNSYFFEVSRLPTPLRMLVHQILKRRGVTLASHPERIGSGPVPNRIGRLAERLGRSLTDAAEFVRRGKQRTQKLDDAAFVRAEIAFMGDIPTERWAAIRYPDDARARAEYNARLGIHSFPSESLETSLHSPPIEPNKRTEGAWSTLRR